MATSIAADKAALRRRLGAARAAIAVKDRDRWSAAIIERTLAHPTVRDAAVVHAFVGALPGEVLTRPLLERLLEAGVRLVCPRVEADTLGHYVVTDLADLAASAMGLWEPDPVRCAPADLATIEVVLTPGLAFDLAGGRLGMGRAYYDRFLATAPATTIALAFELQLVDRVPLAVHDVPVDWIVTERRTIDCRAARGAEGA